MTMGWAAKHIEALQRGETVQFRPQGFSMTGRIENRQLVTVAPIALGEELSKGDVVLCKVNGREFLHLVKAHREGQYLIGNNRGGTNGWTHRGNLFGKCVKVEP